MKHKEKCAQEWKRVERVAGRGYGRAFSITIEQCGCGLTRNVGSKADVLRAYRAAKQEAKREALMLAKAEIQAREGRTAKQRKAARELIS